MTAPETWATIMDALEGITPQSLNWTNNTATGTVSARVHLHTCRQFTMVCDRLGISAAKRHSRRQSGNMAARVEHSAEWGVLLVIHLHWPHSECQPELTLDNQRGNR